MKVRAVLDSSVLLSAERNELLFLARKGVYTLVCSPFIFNEVVRIRTEKAIEHGQNRDEYRARINAFVDAISHVALLVNHTRLEGGNYQAWLNDPDDEPLLATALVGRAAYIVSWNTRDFPPTGSYAHIRFVTPPEFLHAMYTDNVPSKVSDTL